MHEILGLKSALEIIATDKKATEELLNFQSNGLGPMLINNNIGCGITGNIYQINQQDYLDAYRYQQLSGTDYQNQQLKINQIAQQISQQQLQMGQNKVLTPRKSYEADYIQYDQYKIHVNDSVDMMLFKLRRMVDDFVLI